MWIVFALLSALFAGVTAILAKCGIKNTDSDLATAIRTVVVLVFSWVMVFVVGAAGEISQISARSAVFLLLSGAATGASWICYFRALQMGQVHRVVAVDKASTVLTLLLAFLLLQEPITPFRGAATLLIALGTYLMIGKKAEDGVQKSRSWLLYAALSAVFASLTSIFGKIGMSDVNSNLGTAVRTGVVLVFAWGIVFLRKKQTQIRDISRRELAFICLSGIATGASWLCYFYALQKGQTSVVVSIDKLSVLVTILFSAIVFHERPTKKAILGVAALVAGTILMIF